MPKVGSITPKNAPRKPSSESKPKDRSFADKIDEAARKHAGDGTQCDDEPLGKVRGKPKKPRPRGRVLPKPRKHEVCPPNLRQLIDADHWTKLQESGLNSETIVKAGIYSERDTGQLRCLLRGGRVVAPAMIFPFFNLEGQRIDYVVARPSAPIKYSDGNTAKYLVPTGRGSRAYFPLGARDAINAKGETLLITEGILKCLASTQAGISCIGLMGVWNWQRKRLDKNEPRKLIADLEAIDWTGRTVAIVFDFDKTRNPNVNHGAAELARVLTEHGADVRILNLPSRRDLYTKRPRKQGIDDYIVRCREAAFRKWVSEQLESPEVRSLDECRKEMERKRKASLDNPGIYLDRSPTGTGKSYFDGIVLSEFGEDEGSLSLQPTHLNCEEVQRELARLGIDSATFPKLDPSSCMKFLEADKLRGQGLTFQKILCLACEFRDCCGYRLGYKEAMEAQHAIGTHKRGEVQMADMASGCKYIAVHENLFAVLRSACAVQRGLEVIGMIAEHAELNVRQGERCYFRRMKDIAHDLNGWMERSNATRSIPLPDPASCMPKNPDVALHTAITHLAVNPLGDAMRLVRDATDGLLDELIVKVDERFADEGVMSSTRSLIGLKSIGLPSKATVWLNDATAIQDNIETVLGQPIQDGTPSGTLRRERPVLQVIPERDVTRGTEVSKAASILRGILYDLPYRRVGVITHKNLCDDGLQDELGPEYDSRVVMLSYFHGGRARGSNEWTKKCDVLIVLGTPRVPPHAIRKCLIVLGNKGAARLDEDQARWKLDYWSGVTESGKRKTVRTSHYRDHDWHDAYRAIVVSELKQALGRARGILPEGIPAFVVTREETGETIADRSIPPLTRRQADVLGQMYSCRGIPRVCTGPEIADRLGLSRQRVWDLLTELVEAGRVRQYGKKWVATKTSISTRVSYR